ncbi:4Fe-4S double cluster binding domain-containing protein [Methanoregula sp.]|uniref:4Fe-4S double cluster binding domain-containing protein n=1 Tax=Methanoregula sp. TaxID=2052170 RepID=UPI002BC0C659|nr:4Fe-4S double cluster binding domain-containing protein [Methanoregula sp.]HVP97058.1 4Fe-4S double cluster binding domain-containing protein [Methanoregula sp.]
MYLAEELRTSALWHGADYYGIADLAPAREFILAQGGERVARYPRAVVMGIVLQDSLVDLLPEREDPAAAMLYRHNSYDVVNLALDQIALAAANIIQRAGHAALPVPASKRASDEKIASVFSHKLAAHLAGLGWIGKSCLLVTPDHGPRVRWVTVLTDAPLQPTGSPMAERCGTCTQCTDACPARAVTGRVFAENEPREARLDAAACDRYFQEMEKSRGIAVCGMCLYICPHGRKLRGGNGR